MSNISNSSNSEDGVSAALMGQVALASLRSIVQAATLAAAGLYLGKKGIMTKAGAKLLSTMSMKVTIPALLFTRVLPSVDLTLVSAVWPMLLFPFIFVSVGAFFGWLVVKFTKPSDDFRSGTIAAVAFGNSTGMPIVLLSVIRTQLGYLWQSGQSTGTGLQVDDPVVYLSVYLLTYPVIQWVLGGWLLAPAPKLVDKGGATELTPPLVETAGRPAALESGALARLPTVASQEQMHFEEVSPDASGSNGVVGAGDGLRERSMTEQLHKRVSLLQTASEKLGRGFAKSDKLPTLDARRPPVLLLESTDATNLIGLVDGELDAGLRQRWTSINQSPAQLDALEVGPMPHSTSLTLERQSSLHSAVNGDCCARLPSLAEVIAVAKELADRVLVPPVVGVLSGLVCSSIPPVYYLFCGGPYPNRLPKGSECPDSDAPLGAIMSGLTSLGAAAVPINLILLGNALSKGPDWNALPMRVCAGIIVAKLLMMPLFAVGLMVVIERTMGDGGAGIIPLQDPYDEVFFIAACAVACTPTANNMMVMTEIAGGNGAAMSTAIFAQYMVAPVRPPRRR